MGLVGVTRGLFSKLFALKVFSQFILRGLKYFIAPILQNWLKKSVLTPTTPLTPLHTHLESLYGRQNTRKNQDQITRCLHGASELESTSGFMACFVALVSLLRRYSWLIWRNVEEINVSLPSAATRRKSRANIWWAIDRLVNIYPLVLNFPCLFQF